MDWKIKLNETIPEMPARQEDVLDANDPRTYVCLAGVLAGKGPL